MPNSASLFNVTETIPVLQPGDHLLYGVKPRDLFGWVTRIKTWSPAVHIELYVGDYVSVASRNGEGVNKYPVRMEQLIGVLRPRVPIDLAKGLQWFSQSNVQGKPYGWLELLHFVGLKVKSPGWICSQFVALFDEACGFLPFNPEYYEGSVDPGDFFLSPLLEWHWVQPKACLFLRT